MQAPSFAFDGVVRFTRLGAGYLLFTLLIGFAALNTGNNSLYIGLSLMLGALLVSGLASKGGLRGISLELVAVDEAWAGQPAHAILRVANGSRIWNVRDVMILSPLLETPVHVPLAPRGSTIEIPLKFLFTRRGPAKINSLDLYTRYPFGLFLKKRRARLDGEVIVYPRLLEAKPVRAPGGSRMIEAHPRRRAGGGSEVFAFREYVRGDSLRHVHWKKSAGIGRWIMKQLEEETAPALLIAIDPVLPPWEAEERFETMISEAATLLFEMVEAEAEVALILPGERIRGRGDLIRGSLFDALARLEAESSGDLPLVPRGAILFSLRSEHDKQTA